LRLATASALEALAAAALAHADIDGLWWGCTRPPFAEGPSHAVLAAALSLSPRAAGALTSGCAHAGMEALLGAADAVVAGSVRTALVVVSDGLRPGLGTPLEARTGAGAAAVVLAADGVPGALTIGVTRSQPQLDRYRGDGELDTRDLYDARLFREEMFLPSALEIAAHLAPLAPRPRRDPAPDG